MPIKSMVHLNHNLLVATDCETTGLDPEYHEIIQVCFLPLDSRLNPHPDHKIFEMFIRPEHPERADVKIPSKAALTEALKTGFPAHVVFELFEHWFSSLNLPEERRIVPLAYNWAFENVFYRAWMGADAVNQYFDSRARDLFLVIQWLNDRADWDGEEYPFQKQNMKLRTVAKKLGVPVEDHRLHDAVYDCYITTQAYKKTLVEPII